MEISKEIIKSCIKGKRDAQKKLYQMYADKMYGVCLRYADDKDDANDILQDGFIKVFSNIKKYSFKGSFEGWIRRIIVNTALERFRDKNYLFAVNNECKIENFDCEYNHVIEEISVKDIFNIINTLTPQYKTVFNLYVIEGYSHKEIADLLNIKEGTSKSNLSRAREILQKKVTQNNRIKVSSVY